MGARIIDATNFRERTDLTTLGSRNKQLLVDEKGNQWFFKEPMISGQNDKSFETWSEVISSEIGTALGFKVLEYHPGWFDNTFGCLSRNMVPEGKELIHGRDWMNEKFDSIYLDQRREQYSIQLLVDLFNDGQVSHEFLKVIQMLVFDAIIGNQDRHYENWAFISEQQSKTRRKLFGITIHSSESVQQRLEFSPLFDNASSLTAELTEEALKENFFKNDVLDQEALFNYAGRGKSRFYRLNWKASTGLPKKVRHNEVIGILLKSPGKWSDSVREVVSETCNFQNQQKVESLLGEWARRDYSDCTGQLPTPLRMNVVRNLVKWRMREIYSAIEI